MFKFVQTILYVFNVLIANSFLDCDMKVKNCQELFKGRGKKGTKKEGKPFTLQHCNLELEVRRTGRTMSTTKFVTGKSSGGDATQVGHDDASSAKDGKKKPHSQLGCS